MKELKEKLIKSNEELQREWKEKWKENYNEERDYFVFKCNNLDDCYTTLQLIPYDGFLVDGDDSVCYIQNFDDSNEYVDLFAYEINEETFELTIWLYLV